MKTYYIFYPLSIIFIIFFCFVVPVKSLGQDNDREKIMMRLAIVDLQAKGVSKVVAVAVTDLIRSDMVDTGRFTVVERSQMDAILKEHELQQTGCTDSSCAVQLGKILSANKVLIGEINKLGADIIVTVRIVDVEKGVAEFSTNEKAKNIDEIDKAVKTLVDKMTLRITGKRSLAGETGASAYYLRGIVPGWGQIYAGKKLKGAIYMGGFTLTGCAWGYSYYRYLEKKKAYDNLGPKESKAKFDGYYDDYKQSYNIMLYIAGIWGLIYIANWVDIIFITDSPGVVISGIPWNGGFIALDMFNERESAPYQANGIKFSLSYKINF